MLNKKLTGERIKQLRLEKQKTAINVSTILGVDQSYYTKMEKGIHQINTERLYKIAELYDVSVDYLLGRTNKKEVNKWNTK